MLVLSRSKEREALVVVRFGNVAVVEAGVQTFATNCCGRSGNRYSSGYLSLFQRFQKQFNWFCKPPSSVTVVKYSCSIWGNL